MKYWIIVIAVICLIFTSSPALFAGDWGESMLDKEQKGKSSTDKDPWGKDVKSRKDAWGKDMWADTPDKWGKDMKTPDDEWGDVMQHEEVQKRLKKKARQKKSWGKGMLEEDL